MQEEHKGVCFKWSSDGYDYLGCTIEDTDKFLEEEEAELVFKLDELYSGERTDDSEKEVIWNILLHSKVKYKGSPDLTLASQEYLFNMYEKHITC